MNEVNIEYGKVALQKFVTVTKAILTPRNAFLEIFPAKKSVSNVCRPRPPYVTVTNFLKAALIRIVKCEIFLHKDGQKWTWTPP